MELLNDAQIEASLAAVPGWQLAGNAITTTAKRPDFRGAMAYAEAVADLAEAAGHHPDITISWNKVTLTLSTHSAGGLTAKDFALAAQISGIG